MNIQPQKLFNDPDSLLYMKNNEVSVYKTSSLSSLVLSLKGKDAKAHSKLAALRDAGGIIPDFWVTGSAFSDFYQKLFQSGSIDDIALKVLDDRNSSVQAYRTSLERFIANYSEECNFEALVVRSCKAKKIPFDRAGFVRDRKNIVRAVKSKIAHQLFGAGGQIKFLVRNADPLVKIAETVPAGRP